MNQQLTGLRDMIRFRRDSRGGNRNVLVVGGGKGGVGTSTVAAFLALALAERAASVLAVDGNEHHGSLAPLLGQAGATTDLAQLRGGRQGPEDLLVGVNQTLRLLPGGGLEPDQDQELSLNERRLLFRRVSSLYPRFQFVVVDGGSRADSVCAACAAGVARVLAVTVPDRIAAAATFALFKTVRSRFSQVPADLVVNRADPGEAQEVFALIVDGGQRFLGWRPDLAAVLPEDQALGPALSRGPTLDERLTSPVGTELCGLADRLVAAAPAGSDVDSSVIPLYSG